jgi:hypothetical protein
MNIVEITGFSQDFSKVACISTLCSIAKVNIGDAKRIVDEVLEGNVRRVSLTSEQEAHQLVEFLSMHGGNSHLTQHS